MDRVIAYLEMGGYAWFVWPSYGLAALVLGLLFWLSLRGMRRAEDQVTRLTGARRDTAAHRSADG